MVRVVGKEGALGAGVCGNCSSAKDGSFDFVEIHLCKLCVILRSRVLRVMCPR